MGMGLQDYDDRSEHGKGSTRSLTVRKSPRKRNGQRSHKGSTNSDIFTLFPKSESNPYNDVVVGPDGKKMYRSSRRDTNSTKQRISPSKDQATSASRAQVQGYLQACERLEEELEMLKAS